MAAAMSYALLALGHRVGLLAFGERVLAQWHGYPSVVVASVLRTTARSWMAALEEKTPSPVGHLRSRR